MPDVFDEIIDKLPPSVLRLILDFNNDSSNVSANVSNLLHDTQQIKIKQINKELKRKTFDIKCKTEENRNLLVKLKKEIEVLKSLKEPEINQQSIKAYQTKIKELEAQIKTLTCDHDELDLTQLFIDIEDLYKETEEYRKKIAEAKKQNQCYDNFPPDIEQAKEAIAKVKERIKHHELVVESLFENYKKQ